MNSNFLSAFKELDLKEGPASENGMKMKLEKHQNLFQIVLCKVKVNVLNSVQTLKDSYWFNVKKKK